MIGQMFEAIWAGFKVCIHAFLSVLPFYQQLSDLKTQIIAAAIGVPVIVITIAGLLIKFSKFGSNHL